MIPWPFTLLFGVRVYTPFLCFLSSEYPLVFVGELVWWCRILSAFACLKSFNFPKMGKEIATQVQKTQSPKQDKAKAKHPKTHINQINKDQTQRTDIKSSKGNTTNNT